MNRTAPNATDAGFSVPRASGDEPQALQRAADEGVYSPRQRG